MAAFSLSINYEAAHRKARQLETEAKRCIDVENKLKSVRAHVKGNWKGSSADEYIQEINNTINQVRELRNELERIASSIHKVANEFEESDRRLKEKLEQGLEGLVN